MSQLPQLPLPRTTKHTSPPPRVAQTPPPSPPQSSPTAVIQTLCNDPSVPASVKQRLQPVLMSLRVEKDKKREEAIKKEESADATVRNSHVTQQQWALQELVSGRAPLRNSLYNATASARATAFDIATSTLQSNKAGVHRVLCKRPTAALQDPADVFAAMNRITFQTLRYVEDVETLEFNVHDIKELDGSVMTHKERLFLSVCCSVFANFALCTSLKLDIPKLVQFLKSLFQQIPVDGSFHGPIHAADALQMVSLFFRDPSINFLFTDEEILFSLLSVLCVFVAHPGVGNTSLAAMNHPLSTVFGDINTTESASLLVFLHELLRDENFFISSQDDVGAKHLVRESMYDIVSNAAARARPRLTAQLRAISSAHTVRHDDVPALQAALLCLATFSFSLRPRAQCVALGKGFAEELQREREEMRRRNLATQLSFLEVEHVNRFVTDFCAQVVKPLADAIKGIVPPDLFENLERNVDPTVLRDEKDGVVLGPVAVPWIDSTSSVVEMLKKAATHAHSLDRKASKRAILNASPPRNAGSSVRPLDWKVSGNSSCSASSPSSPYGSAESPAAEFMSLGASVTNLDSPRTPPLQPAASMSPDHQSRSEHYFSFLRLYDKCENEGQSADAFGGQLVFLALQLDPRYFSQGVLEEFGTDGSGAECVEMARYIMETEEVPSSAEQIASRVPGSQSSRKVETKGTDSFILMLLDMYRKREDAAEVPAELRGATPLEMTQDNDGNASTGTRSPRSPRSPPRGGGTPPMRDSPIRLPVNTDTGDAFPSRPSQ